MYTTSVEEFKDYNWNIISFVKLKQLKLFRLHQDLFINATNLKKLDLSGNPDLCFTGNEFFHLKNLQTLRLSGTGRCKGIQLLEKLPNLYSLDLSNLRHDIGLLPTNLLYFNNLRNVDISGNKEIDFKTFKLGRSVKYLNASNTKIILGTRCFADASQLKTLILSNAGLQRLPRDSFKDTSLDVLDLSHNSLTMLDVNGLKGITAKQLNLSHNDIAELDSPETFSPELEVLDLSHNKLNSTHADVFWLSNKLTYLNLAHNQQSWLFENQFMEQVNLLTLDLSYNQLNRLYDLVFKSLEKLETLDLSRNSLAFLGSVFNTNKKLTTLLLNDNRLTTLRVLTFVELKNLKTLDVRNNLLKELPDSLPQIGRMQFLRASCNKISYLPKNYFKGNVRLRVSLQGNPWQCGCILAVLTSTPELELDREYFVAGTHPTCYIRNDGEIDYSICSKNPLRKEDNDIWDEIMSTANVEC